MAIDLVEKYLPYVDELFTTESKKELLTNKDFAFKGAHIVKIYKISTGKMNDYGRSGPDSGNWSRYGAVESLNATTQTCTLSKDRSFTFAIDALDSDETGDSLEAATALARQVREVVIPEVDTISCNKLLDDEQVPETGRVLVVTPATYLLMKQCKDITMETDIGNDMRIRGVIANLDGLTVIKIPASRLPEKFGFMVAHPCATVAPTKLESYITHHNPPGINGDLVEGRVVYDAFVLDNKKKAICYQELSA